MNAHISTPMSAHTFAKDGTSTSQTCCATRSTNAMLHGSLRDRLIRVRIVLTGSVLRIEVSDPRSERLPSPRPHGGGRPVRGRGLLLVGALADRWGLAPRTVGKTVYAEWDLVGKAVLLVDAKQ